MSNDSCGGDWHIFVFLFVNFKRVVLSTMRCVFSSVESVYKNCERLNEACYTKLRRLIANHYTIMYTEPD